MALSSSHHIFGVVESDLSGAAQAAHDVDESPLSGLDGFEGDRAMSGDLAFELYSGRAWEFREEQTSKRRRDTHECGQHLVERNQPENCSEVGTVEEVQVFEIHEVRQGSPPAHRGSAR